MDRTGIMILSIVMLMMGMIIFGVAMELAKFAALVKFIFS